MTIRIVLVGTTHPGNIGAVARAMKNMGVDDLVLVNPKYFPHEDAVARASGATDVLDNATVVASLADALADCVYVAGASARSRTIEMPALDPRTCAERMRLENRKGKVAAVFGPESSGLSNDDLDRCHTLLTIPTNPNFSSLNLAMAVQVLTYELRVAASLDDHTLQDQSSGEGAQPLASSEEMERFYVHFESVLKDVQFMDPDNPRYLMRRMRRLFGRAQPDMNEVNILRGFFSAIDRLIAPNK